MGEVGEVGGVVGGRARGRKGKGVGMRREGQGYNFI